MHGLRRQRRVAPGDGLVFDDTARWLILEGASQTNSYTEPLVHEMRRRKKRGLASTCARKLARGPYLADERYAQRHGSDHDEAVGG